MKIAVTYENGNVFQHFGHTSQFKIYQIDEAMVSGDKIEGGKIANAEIVDTNGVGHGALADFLKERDVQFLICGGIGGGAQTALKCANITVFGGCTGNADSCVEDLLCGKLKYDPSVHCDHHEGGNCGEHNCGAHNSTHETEKSFSKMKFAKK